MIYKIRKAPGNTEFLQKMLSSFIIITVCTILYWIDPQGWKGIIPLNISNALVIVACSVGISGMYLIGSGLVSTLEKISPELTEKFQKGDRLKIFVINAKHLLDFLAIAMMCILPDYQWVFYGIYLIYTSVAYSSVCMLTVYCCFHLVREMQRLGDTSKKGAQSFEETSRRMKRFLRDAVFGELFMRPLVLASAIYWLMGQYNSHNYYETPSFGMGLFVNFGMMADSLIIMTMFNMYNTLGYAAKPQVHGKDTVVMVLLSKLLVSGRDKAHSTESHGITSGQSGVQAVP